MLGRLIADRKTDVLAHPDFPSQHQTRVPSKKFPERANNEAWSRADVVATLPNGGFIIRLVSAVLLETNDGWQTQNRSMQIEPMAELMTTGTTPETARIPAASA